MSPTLPVVPTRPGGTPQPVMPTGPTTDTPEYEYSIQLADGSLLPATTDKGETAPFLTKDRLHAQLAAKQEADKLAAMGVPSDYWPKVVRRTRVISVTAWGPDDA